MTITSSDRLTAGEQVAVTVTGVVALVDGDGLYLEFPDGSTLIIPVAAAATVERLVPADGVPQPGDVWADRTGKTRWVRGTGSPGVRLVDTYGHDMDWRHALRLYGPLTLAYRPAPVEVESTSDGA